MSADQKLIAERWMVSVRTVQNWVLKGEECSKPPPLMADDPEEFLDWYRTQMGREPSRRLLERSREIKADLPLEEVPDEVAIETAPIDLLKSVLARLGLHQTLARVVEESERAHAAYQVAREEGRDLTSSRKRWREAEEMKRQLQKSEDCVAAATELVREWVKREWDPTERKIREALCGKKLGAQARLALMETSTLPEWERVWDREMEAALRMDDGKDRRDG